MAYTPPATPKVTYTPNGIAKAAGYNDPNNPFDTGREGERNAELGGGGKNTMSGWDYATGRPRAGSTLGADGMYKIMQGGAPGGGAPKQGRFTPTLGTYGADSARAKMAWDQAQVRVKTGKQRLNQNFGMTRDPSGRTGIDPNNRYGAVQLMLRNQAGQLNQADEGAMNRRIGRRGLGSQGESDLRFGHGQQSMELGNAYNNQFSDLTQDEADAQAAYQQALLEAQYAALQQASWDYGDSGGWDGGGSDGGDDGSSDPSGPAGPGSATLPAANKLARALIAQQGKKQQRRPGLGAVVNQRSAGYFSPKAAAPRASSPTLRSQQNAYQAAARPAPKKKGK